MAAAGGRLAARMARTTFISTRLEAEKVPQKLKRVSVALLRRFLCLGRRLDRRGCHSGECSSAWLGLASGLGHAHAGAKTNLRETRMNVLNFAVADVRNRLRMQGHTLRPRRCFRGATPRLRPREQREHFASGRWVHTHISSARGAAVVCRCPKGG
jgi:hypothetical protein